MNPLLILLTFIATISFANECTKKRLDESGGPLEGATVLDQDGLNLCRHYAGSKVADCVRFYLNGKNKPKFETSPIPLAIQLAAESNLSELEEAANSGKMIDFALNNGSCSHNAVRNRFGISTDQGYCNEVKTVLRSITSKTLIATPSSNLSCNLKRDEDNNFRSTSLLSKALHVEESVSSLKNEMAKVCNGPNVERSPNAPKAKQLFGYKNPDTSSRISDYKNQIDSLLDSKNPMPTEVLYCFDFMLANQSNAVGVNQTDGKHYKHLCKDGLHASLVAGRRPGPRGCQYLIHNSHGTSCNQYDSKWECENGKIWVDEESLFKNTTGLTFVEIP